jgi:hypothetical protein
VTSSLPGCGHIPLGDGNARGFAWLVNRAYQDLVKRILYVNEAFTTGDAIAEAVLRCAMALAKAGTAETIAIPIVDDANERRDVTLLIGPASQIALEEGPPDMDELVDEAVVARLDALAAQRGPLVEPSEIPNGANWDGEL